MKHHESGRHIEQKTASEPFSEDEQVLFLKSQLTATPPDWDAVKSALDKWQLPSMALSSLACEIVSENCSCEYNFASDPAWDESDDPDYPYEEYRKVIDENLVSYYLPDIIRLFLDYGMNPNDIVNGPDGEHNIMMLLQYVDYKDTAAQCLRLLIERGGIPEIKVDGESLFEVVDSDIIVSDILGTHEQYEILLHHMLPIWFVLVGYGCRLPDGRSPVEMKNGYTQKQFMAFERFRWEVKWRNPTEDDNSRWYIHIYDQENGAETAVL